MAQKWNLGDIIPPERSKGANRPMSHATHGVSDMRKREGSSILPPRPAMRHELEQRVVPTSDRPTGNGNTYNERKESEEMDEDIRDIKIKVGKQDRFKRYIILTAAALLAIAAGIGTTMAMSGAEVMVKPKTKEVTVSAIIDAKKNPTASDLGYELLTLSEDGERRVSATGQEKVSTKATGQIIVSNDFSATKQRLIKNTRFESVDGYIFRIVDSIEIPGFTKNASGGIVAGTAVAKVIADGPGDTYNVKPSRFTIPGLKGSEQYDKVYGVTKDAMTGGFEGMKFIIDDGELSKARQELHLELREKLLGRLKKERPNGFVFFEPSITFAYDTLPPTDAGAQTVVIKDQVRLLAPLFKTDSFAKYLAVKTIPGYEGEAVRLESLDKLNFSYPATSTDISTSDTLKFRIEGGVKMVWVYDMEKLRGDLKGLAETTLPSVLSSYPAIERSRVTIRPFWKNSFPTNLEKIRIIESFDLTE